MLRGFFSRSWSTVGDKTYGNCTFLASDVRKYPRVRILIPRWQGKAAARIYANVLQLRDVVGDRRTGLVGPQCRTTDQTGTRSAGSLTPSTSPCSSFTTVTSLSTGYLYHYAAAQHATTQSTCIRLSCLYLPPQAPVHPPPSHLPLPHGQHLHRAYLILSNVETPVSSCTEPSTQFGLKEPSLIHQQAYIDGEWVDAKGGAVIKVTSAHPALSLILPSRLIAAMFVQTRLQRRTSGQCRRWGWRRQSRLSAPLRRLSKRGARLRPRSVPTSPLSCVIC